MTPFDNFPCAPKAVRMLLPMLAHTLQRSLPLAILSVAVVSVPVLIVEPDGFPRMRSLEKELAGVQGENAELKRDIQNLRATVRELRDNPAAVEKIARDQLGLVRKNEVVFQF